MSSENIVGQIYEYCIQNGYIERLNESQKSFEPDRFNLREIDKNGLDVLDAIHCLVDQNRTYLLLSEIEKIVKNSDNVLEAGVGTGILSFAASGIGAAVFGLELNPQVLALAQDISDYLEGKNWKNLDNAKFVLADATNYSSPCRFDVIISENIYTGLFYEKQVQIMNNLVRFLKPYGKVIPFGLKSGVSLIDLQVPFSPKAYELFVVNEFPPAVSFRELTDSVIYSSLNFESQNEEFVDCLVSLDVAEEGVANAVLIWSNVLMYGNREIERFDTKFMNNDIVLFLPEEIQLRKGEEIKLLIQYQCGCNPSAAKFSFE